MRQYRMQETKEIEKIVCNRCGKELLAENGIIEADFLNVEKRWGYFSKRDNERHSFDLCEKCYDEIVATFQIPVDIEE